MSPDSHARSFPNTPKITPSDKDDKALDAAKRGLGFVSAVLDKVSIWNWQKK